ncbi:MAG TPA: protein kinase [Polyangiales bacterium]
MAAPFPTRETERLQALVSCGVLDTAPERNFDHIVQLASQICSTPIALVSLVDRSRQWFKAKVGLAADETPRDQSFCAYAILESDPLIVQDASTDPRFRDNPLVLNDPNIRFYAGIPLLLEPGIAVGSLCVIDRVPRELSEAQLTGLKLLADQVIRELTLRRELSAARAAAAQRAHSPHDTIRSGLGSVTLTGEESIVGQHSQVVAAGSVIGGRYRVLRTLGAGGMGQVTEAHDLVSGESVAVKFMLPERLSEPEALARFVREAQAMRRIRSEHVAQLRDVGNLPSGVPYIVMDYLEGEDLADRLLRESLLPPSAALEIALQACQGVRAAHACGVLHRDLKPGNLYLCAGGAARGGAAATRGELRVQVLDFGISKIWSADFNAAQTSLTSPRNTMGSPHYMSPEQMMTPEQVDVRTDVWSMGVLLYQMLTGEIPFPGRAFPEICLNVIGAAPRAMQEHNPDLNDAIERLVQRCLQKERSERFADMDALIEALRDVA